MSVTKIKKITKISNISKRYDIQTATHNFFANGILVHNSIIGLFHHNCKWIMTTRGVIEGGCQVGTFPLTFKELFEKTASQYPNFWKGIDEIHQYNDYCYVFELTSPENRVVTPYNERSLHLLAVRSRTHDFVEMPYQIVSQIASRLGVNIPTMHTFADIDSLVHMAAKLEGLAEGFVCVDYNHMVNGSFSRMKVKNPAYLAIAHLKESSATSVRSLLQLIITGETGEFLAYFPEYKIYIDPMEKKWVEYREGIAGDLREAAKVKQTGSRKDYALWAQRCTSPSVMFLFYDGKITTVQDWINLMIKEKGTKNFGKMMMGLLKIKDMEWEQQ